MALRAIVFDFDGVIANSEPLHFRAFRDVLADAGVTLTEHDYYARYLGFSDDDLFVKIQEDAGTRWTLDEVAVMLEKKARRMEAIEGEVSVLFPGAADAIRRAAEAFPLAIASGALRHEIERVLERENLSRFFRAVVGANDTARSKPAPDPYLLAVERLSAVVGTRIEPRDCVAIEDSRWGLQSARAAGLRTVGVAHTYPESDLIDADWTVSSIADLDLGALLA